jgi:hypothetical protein
LLLPHLVLHLLQRLLRPRRRVCVIARSHFEINFIYFSVQPRIKKKVIKSKATVESEDDTDPPSADVTEAADKSVDDQVCILFNISFYSIKLSLALRWLSMMTTLFLCPSRLLLKRSPSLNRLESLPARLKLLLYIVSRLLVISLQMSLII